MEVRSTSSAWMRRMRAPIEWKVPIQGIAGSGSTNPAIRAFISRAALLVKVTARISWPLALLVRSICAILVVRTRVLPVPAPASTSRGPSVDSTAWRCSSLRPTKYVACWLLNWLVIAPAAGRARGWSAPDINSLSNTARRCGRSSAALTNLDLFSCEYRDGGPQCIERGGVTDPSCERHGTVACPA